MSGTKKNTKAKSTLSQQLFEIGKLPPQAVELEEVVLGALMLDKDSLLVVPPILSPESFYKEAHTRIYKAIVSLIKLGEPIDILTVTSALRKSEELELVGGAWYITQLTNRVASGANAEYHARIIQQKYMQREVIRISTDTIKDCYADKDIFDIFDSNATQINQLESNNTKSTTKNTTAIFTELTQNLEKIAKSDETITGVPSGLTELDKLTNGWQNSDLIILAGRPAMGKTALTKRLIKGAHTKQIPVAMFSLEMSSYQLATRLISEDVQVSSDAFKSKKFLEYTDFNHINTAISKYYTPDNKDLLFIDDVSSLTIQDIKTRAKQLYRQYGIGLVILDYLQLADTEDGQFGNREQEISKISRGLKQLAKEINVPVIALSQLSRATESQGGDMRPKLSHLRESGAIEQDADIVGFLWRPEYYYEQTKKENFREVEYKGEMIPSEGFTELTIAKNRNGGLGTIAMRFKDRYTQFEDWEKQYVPHANPNGFIEPTKEVTDTAIVPNNDFLNEKKNNFEEPPF